MKQTKSVGKLAFDAGPQRKENTLEISLCRQITRNFLVWLDEVQLESFLKKVSNGQPAWLYLCSVLAGFSVTWVSHREVLWTGGPLLTCRIPAQGSPLAHLY